MSKDFGKQKIKCDVKECAHNCEDKTCELNEIKVCCCNGDKVDTHKDTACKSYDSLK